MTMRKTSQPLVPERHPERGEDSYDIYPGFPIGSHKIQCGFRQLAQAILAGANSRPIILDGYAGVCWETVRTALEHEFGRLNAPADWSSTREFMWPEETIQKMIAPYLGDHDPLFGKRFPGKLTDFFDMNRFPSSLPASGPRLQILYGDGASLYEGDCFLVYLDVPKNEIQFRARASAISNLGASQPEDHRSMYKRFYFVDWVVLNQQKAKILSDIDLYVDDQRDETPLFVAGEDLRNSLRQMSRNFFRVRPWFEPGAWGGQWIKNKISQLPQEVPNYAWSFELIVPENGLLFESDGYLLEASFDTLMFFDHQAILGDSANIFGYEFPIRFDFLDTFDGGNLSIQCHPRLKYIRENFGETITQDETYYILDCEPGAKVYLGFQETICPTEFRDALETSARQGTPVDIDRFVYSLPAHKHDLFLIPNGTIHGSGKNNLVLEISSTPYIFTFKMYDWVRLDLDGKPRPLNIARAFDNLSFSRKGKAVEQELTAKPQIISQGAGWEIEHLPTHQEHFYDVERFSFQDSIEVALNGSCHVLNVVEGGPIRLETEQGMSTTFAYAETFVIPAAAHRYHLINEGKGRAQVVKAFIKESRQVQALLQ